MWKSFAAVGLSASGIASPLAVDDKVSLHRRCDQMPNIELRIHPSARRASAKIAKVMVRHLRAEGGHRLRVRTIDANSQTFGNDFLYVFELNVRAARQENRERFGWADPIATDS